VDARESHTKRRLQRLDRVVIATDFGVSREPITTKGGRAIAFELRYRGSMPPGVCQATIAAARRRWEALAAPGFKRCFGDSPVFIDLDEDLLVGKLALLLPPGQGVAAIPASLKPTPAIIKLLNELRRSAIEIALDDFQFQPHAMALLRYAHYVKVDVQRCAGALRDIAESLRPYNLPLIADNVRTHDDLTRCWELGFHLFQGYHHSQPEPLELAHLGI
jgi:EAL and modified HD-GYP domain-containing signal transduction protein